VIVEAAVVVPADDDRRVVPIFTVRDRVDERRDECFGDLVIGVARSRMIVVT
jgi:hypothetical protein